MILTTSFKFNKNTFYDQIDYALKFNFKNVIFKDEYKALMNYSKEELKSMYDYAKSKRITVIAIDTNIKPFNLKNEESILANYNKYEQLIKVANALRVKNLFMVLPKISEIVVEHDAIKEALTPLHDLISKEKINISFKPNNVYNVYAYIFHQRDFKNFYMYFDVVKMYQHKSSLATSYRLLKDFMKFIVINDIDNKKRPVLIPHGITKIDDLFERMKKDDYREYAVIDEKLIKLILETRKKPLWTKISKKWFKKGDLQDQVVSNSSTVLNLNSSKNEEITGDDVFNYYIDYLSNYFKTQQ